MTIIPKSVIHAVALFVLSLGILFAAYPWSIYHLNFKFPWQRTLVSYIALAILTTIACSVIPWWATTKWITKLSVHGDPGAGGIFFSVCCVGLLILTMIFGGIGLALDIPGTRVHGIFFAEWEFITFLIYVGTPLGAIGAALMLVLRRGSPQP